jgi:hypothetical protein
VRQVHTIVVVLTVVGRDCDGLSCDGFLLERGERFVL